MHRIGTWSFYFFLTGVIYLFDTKQIKSIMNMKKNLIQQKQTLLQTATRNLGFAAAVLLVGAVVFGFVLSRTGVWGDWGEPVAWAVGIAVQVILILAGIQILDGVQTRMEKRTFEITLGLRRGYGDDAQVIDGAQAVTAIKEWTNTRIAAGHPVLQGKFWYGQGVGLVYPMRNGIDADVLPTATEEPLFMFTGEMSPKYDAGRSDAEVILTLRDLAMYLGRKFDQKRMYYSFRGTQYAEDVV